jgi:hypothetical protein
LGKGEVIHSIVFAQISLYFLTDYNYSASHWQHGIQKFGPQSNFSCYKILRHVALWVHHPYEKYKVEYLVD